MLDTFEIQFNISYELKELLYETLNAMAKIEGGKCLHADKRNQKKKVTAAFQNFGILEIYLEKKKYDFQIGLKVKPQLVLTECDMYYLLDEGDLIKAVKVVNHFIDSLNFKLKGVKLPFCEYWTIKRIDYAFQFTTKHYQAYLDTLQKYLPESAVKYDGSIWLASKSTNINFYDKTKQISDKNPEKVQCFALEHMLRFEVQCQRKYLQHLKDIGKIQEICLKELWNKNLAFGVLQNKMAESFTLDDFYSLEGLETVIADNLSPCKRRRLLQLYYDTTKLPCACEKDRELIDYQVSKVQKKLRKIGVAYFRIDDDFKIDYLPNPLKIIKEREFT